MSHLRISLVAEADAMDIVLSIGRDNAAAAAAWAVRFEEKCELLATNPGLGQRRPDLPGGAYRVT